MKTFYNLGRELGGNLPDSLYDALQVLDAHMDTILRLAYQGAMLEPDLLKDRAAVIEALAQIDRALGQEG